MSTLVEPEHNKNHASISAQLILCNEILDFNVFPMATKTGENIKKWFLQVLSENEISHAMVSGITPDGAADGQCGLSLIDTLAEKVDTCLLHQLQRAVLYSVGLAGAACQNKDAKELLRKNNRIVMLSHQSLATNKAIKEAQLNAGVGDHDIRTLVSTATTRWGNQFQQIERNNLLRLAIDPSVEKFKREHKNEKEAIVEHNESDQGSKVGAPVPASAIGLTPEDWECNQELESFLSYPYEIKQSIELLGYVTGAQALMLLFDLKDKFCRENASLEVQALPASLKLCDRVRAFEYKQAAQCSPMIEAARKVMKKELQERCFDARPSNARMVQLYMSKQMDSKDILTREQFELAKTLYFTWLRHAATIALANAAPCASSNKAANTANSKAQRLSNGSKLFRGAKCCVSADDTPSVDLDVSSSDRVSDEIERWARLPPEMYSCYVDEENQLINEFQMMFHLRNSFPLHYIVFKQTACHVPHEAFVEQVSAVCFMCSYCNIAQLEPRSLCVCLSQVFSTAGRLSTPHTDPDFLVNLVMICRNKKTFKPSADDIKDKYYEMYRGGQGGDDEAEIGMQLDGA